MAVVQLIAKADRRGSNRLPTPRCPQCGTDGNVTAVVRTAKFVYFRCAFCREVLPTAIPPVVLRHGLIAHLSN